MQTRPRNLIERLESLVARGRAITQSYVASDEPTAEAAQ
jgi:hypothetical protein